MAEAPNQQEAEAQLQQGGSVHEREKTRMGQERQPHHMIPQQLAF